MVPLDAFIPAELVRPVGAGYAGAVLGGHPVLPCRLGGGQAQDHQHEHADSGGHQCGLCLQCCGNRVPRPICRRGYQDYSIFRYCGDHNIPHYFGTLPGSQGQGPDLRRHTQANGTATQDGTGSTGRPGCGYSNRRGYRRRHSSGAARREHPSGRRSC